MVKLVHSFISSYRILQGVSLKDVRHNLSNYKNHRFVAINWWIMLIIPNQQNSENLSICRLLASLTTLTLNSSHTRPESLAVAKLKTPLFKSVLCWKCEHFIMPIYTQAQAHHCSVLPSLESDLPSLGLAAALPSIRSDLQEKKNRCRVQLGI